MFPSDIDTGVAEHVKMCWNSKVINGTSWYLNLVGVEIYSMKDT